MNYIKEAESSSNCALTNALVTVPFPTTHSSLDWRDRSRSPQSNLCGSLGAGGGAFGSVRTWRGG